MSPFKGKLKSQPQVLLNVAILERVFRVNQITMRSSAQALMQHDCVRIKRGHLDPEADMPRGKMATEGGGLQPCACLRWSATSEAGRRQEGARHRLPREAGPANSWILDFQPPEWDPMHVVLSHLVMVLCLASPCKLLTSLCGCGEWGAGRAPCPEVRLLLCVALGYP